MTTKKKKSLWDTFLEREMEALRTVRRSFSRKPETKEWSWECEERFIKKRAQVNDTLRSTIWATCC